jgi:hypothetical protein
MARGKEILPAAASIEFQYHSVADMPWQDIESAAGKQFSLEERHEIYHCAQGFDWEHQYLSKAPALREVERLRSDLLKHCRALTALANRYPPKEIGRVRESEAPGVVAALQIYFGTEDFVFRDAYERLEGQAREIMDGLSKLPQFETDTLKSTPETAGLTAFLERVLDGAEMVRARATPPGSFVREGYEYRRWGMAIGPRADGFAKFSAAVLSRPVTKGMLRTAWPELPGNSSD